MVSGGGAGLRDGNLVAAVTVDLSGISQVTVEPDGLPRLRGTAPGPCPPTHPTETKITTSHACHSRMSTGSSIG